MNITSGAETAVLWAVLLSLDSGHGKPIGHVYGE